MTVKYFPVETIITEGLQTRVSIDQATVREYAELSTTGGVKLPPIVVFQTDEKVWCADGLHRLAAAKQTKQLKISAEVHAGGHADALKYALSSNATHGLRRTNADKAQAVKMAYEHRKELGLPDVPAANLIAEIIGVSPHTVEAQLSNLPSWRDAIARTGADGKTRDLPPVPVRPKPQVAPVAPSAPPQRPASIPVIPPPAMPPPPVPVHQNPPPVRSKPETAGQVDERGKHIPEDLLPVWNRRQEVQDMATLISRVRSTLRNAQEGNDPLWGEINFSSVQANLDRVYTEITAAQPWCVCPMCQGIGCRACKERGLMGKFRYDNSVPAELKV